MLAQPNCRKTRRKALCRMGLSLTVIAILLGGASAQAAPPQLTITPDADLRFGSFAVINQGYITVSPTGTVQSQGIVKITSGDTGPARFTISYDRGNNSRRRLNLVIQLVFSNPGQVTVGGVDGQLSDYRTDLPNATTIAPGQIVELTIPNCIQRVCSRSFSLGARLDVRSRYGGGQLSVPIPVDGAVVSVS